MNFEAFVPTAERGGNGIQERAAQDHCGRA
jgi:hypothetical protein